MRESRRKKSHKQYRIELAAKFLGLKGCYSFNVTLPDYWLDDNYGMFKWIGNQFVKIGDEPPF